MPKLQTFVVDHVPEPFQGQSWRAPTSSPLRANAAAEDFPALVKEGLTGPIYIESISAYAARNGPDGRPLLYRIVAASIGGQS